MSTGSVRSVLTRGRSCPTPACPCVSSPARWRRRRPSLRAPAACRATRRTGTRSAAARRIEDRYGNAIVLTRNGAGDLTRITSPNGRWIQLSYDGNYHRVKEARDHTNRVVQYAYDGSGRQWKATDPAGGVTEYTYDAAHRMLTIEDARGIVYLTNEYDAAGRVIRQTQADSTTYAFAYTLNGAGEVTQTDVTNPRGFLRRVTFDAAGYALSDSRAVGSRKPRPRRWSGRPGPTCSWR